MEKERVLETPENRTRARGRAWPPGSSPAPRALRCPLSAPRAGNSSRQPAGCPGPGAGYLEPPTASGAPWANPVCTPPSPPCWCASKPGESIRRPREALKKSKQNVPGTHAGKTIPCTRKEMLGARGRAGRFIKWLWPSAAFTQFNKLRWCNMTVTLLSGAPGKTRHVSDGGRREGKTTSQLPLGKFAFCAFPEPVSLKEIKEPHRGNLERTVFLL